jgi:hypothetical protein
MLSVLALLMARVQQQLLYCSPELQLMLMFMAVDQLCHDTVMGVLLHQLQQRCGRFLQELPVAQTYAAHLKRTLHL